MKARKKSKRTADLSMAEKWMTQSEVYRQLRTNIEYSSVERPVQVVNITSTKENEGKTTIAVNLAMVSTAQYDRVLLVDCDLRKPAVHRFLGLSNRSGLSNLLFEEHVSIQDERYFQKVSGESGSNPLYVLTSGVQVPNPLELLSSDKFSHLITQLRAQFDFIVLDCTPVLAVSDAVPVSRTADGTIFIVSANDTVKQDARLALTTLQRTGIHVLGAVLNKIDASSEGYYRYYYSQ